MTGHLVEALFGFLGGSIPGSLHFAWKVTHNNHVTSGTLDLTYRGPRKQPKK